VTKLNRLLLGAFGVGAIGLGTFGAAQAATVLSDTLTIYNGQGKVWMTLSAPEALGESAITYVVTGHNFDTTQVPTYLMDPASEGGGVSDIVGIFPTGNHGKQMALGFISNDEASLGQPGPGTVVQEVADPNNPGYAVPIDVTRYLTANLQQKGWTATFTSDVEPVGSVPEPAAWALMLGGFGVAGYGVRRRKISAAAV